MSEETYGRKLWFFFMHGKVMSSLLNVIIQSKPNPSFLSFIYKTTYRVPIAKSVTIKSNPAQLAGHH